MEKLPVYSADLIKMLDQMYPERCPGLAETEREIWHYVGARSVVRMLLSRLAAHEEDHLVNSLKGE